MLITVGEGTGAMVAIGLEMLDGMEDVGEDRREAEIVVVVGAEPIGEATEDVGLVELPALKGQEIFENFRRMAQARGATHTPLAGQLPHTVAELSR